MTAKRVATEETRWLSFWARGADDGYLRRRAWALRWLRRHGRLRGGRISRLRVVRSVAGERDEQAEANRKHLEQAADAAYMDERTQ